MPATGGTALGFPVPPPLKEDEAARVHAVRTQRQPRRAPRRADAAARAKLREALRLDELPADSPEARFCTDACLCRYLRARAWDVGKAAKMLEASLQWRAAVGIEELSFADVAAEAETGKMQRLTCRDSHGRPVLCMRPGRENTRHAAGQIRFLQWTMEDMVRVSARRAAPAPGVADAHVRRTLGLRAPGPRHGERQGRLPARQRRRPGA